MKRAKILLAVMSLCAIFSCCRSDSEKARAMLNNARVLIREQKSDQAKVTLKDLVKQYPHTEEATEANKVLDAFQMAEDMEGNKLWEIKFKEIELALQLFSLDIGRYPTQKEGLRALSINPGIAKWKGPYLLEAPEIEELMGRFDYFCPGTNNEKYSLLPKKHPDARNP